MTDQEEPETTGHEWDGIREYNNPLPRWWLWTFYGTIIWALIYTIAFPAWPLISSATPGLLGYSSRVELAQEMKEYEERNAPLALAIVAADLSTIEADPALRNFALQGGAAIFRTYCSQCHGAGAAGFVGYPNLLDDDWLWGGDLNAIHETIQHGIRAANDDTRDSAMPAFEGVLDDREIAAVTQYILSLSAKNEASDLLEEGATVFADNCASCHGDTGLGDRELGAPNLTDAIWLYGADPATMEQTILLGRLGMMPAWNTRLSEAQIRQVAIYVHNLGGGE